MFFKRLLLNYHKHLEDSLFSIDQVRTGKHLQQEAV